MAKWEYKRIIDEKGNPDQIIKELNDLGGSGWEVISVMPVSGYRFSKEILLKRQDSNRPN